MCHIILLFYFKIMKSLLFVNMQLILFTEENKLMPHFKNNLELGSFVYMEEIPLPRSSYKML